MKNILLVAFVISIRVVSAQHLTFNDLLLIYKSNIESCDELLIQKRFVIYNSETKEKNDITWTYKRTSSEYIIKNCSSIFFNDCDGITYMTSDLNCYNKHRQNMKSELYKYLVSTTNENGVLSHHYLGEGPLEYIFSTIPTNSELKVNVFTIEIKKMDIK